MMYFVEMIVFVVGFAVVGTLAHDSGYRKGQIDAINSVVKYELKTNQDGSTSWERKENSK